MPGIESYGWYRKQGAEPAATASVTITFATEGIGPYTAITDYDVEVIRGSVSVDTKTTTTVVLKNLGSGATTDAIYEVLIKPRNVFAVKRDI